MPRYGREKSEAGIYHVMLRGVDRMDIFLDRGDNVRFLDTLRRFKETNSYELYAYCLMRNHVHLLIKEVEDSMERMMKRVGVSYVYYFNQKYNRVGHLFQDRYRSEVIDSEQYFLGCGRYIHNNPVVAGLVSSPQEYPWSSYSYYLRASDNAGLLTIDPVLDCFSRDRPKAVLGFKQFTESAAEDEYLEYQEQDPAHRVARPEWQALLAETLQKHNTSLKDLRTIQNSARRKLILREIKSTSGLSVRELSRLLGISKDSISRA